jgi:hypothetical protein
MNIWGYTERSTDHALKVTRVKNYLKTFCTETDVERSLVPGRITDAFGYDKVTNTFYVCEIKVSPGDWEKAITQLHITSSNYKPRHTNTVIIPVFAIPNRLATELLKYKPLEWKSIKSLCKNNKIAIWIIEQSSIRQIQGPKPRVLKSKTGKATKKTKTRTKKKAITSKKKTTKQTSKTVKKPKHRTTVKAKATAKPRAATKKRTARKTSKTLKNKR